MQYIYIYIDLYGTLVGINYHSIYIIYVPIYFYQLFYIHFIKPVFQTQYMPHHTQIRIQLHISVHTFNVYMYKYTQAQVNLAIYAAESVMKQPSLVSARFIHIEIGVMITFVAETTLHYSVLH